MASFRITLNDDDWLALSAVFAVYGGELEGLTDDDLKARAAEIKRVNTTWWKLRRRKWGGGAGA